MTNNLSRSLSSLSFKGEGITANILKVIFIYGIFLLMPKTAKGEFVPLKDDRTQSCSLQLFAARKIPHQCQVTTDESSPLEVWKNRLSFHFGKISESDFIFLKNTYSGWSQSQSSVSYDPNKSYQLVDFLPPLIQALNGHRFIPEETKLKSQDWYFLKLVYSAQADLKKYLYLNCWGLVYEVLRAAKNSQAEASIFMAQSSIMLSQIRNNSELLLTKQEPSEFPIPGALTQPGDIILIMHKSLTGYEYLDHIAIAIDDGIYFEKAGTGADVPIRMIDEVTLLQIWPPGVFRYELRRLHQNALLPHPKDIFGLNSPFVKEQLFPLTEIPSNISQDTTMMWDIESKSLSSISWFYMIDLPPLSRDNTGKARLTEKLYQPLLKDK